MRHPVAPADVDTVRSLTAAAEAADGHPPFGDTVWRDLAHPSPSSAGFLALVDGAPAGYADLAEHRTGADAATRGTEWALAVVVHPSRRGAGVASALVNAAVEHAGANAAPDGRSRIVLWAFGVDDRADAFAARAGFRPERELWQMRVRLPLAGAEPRWPDGVTVRTFVPGADDHEWLAVNNRAFAADPDQGGWDEATLRERLHEPWFDPAGFLLAVDAAGLAGFCWTKVHPAAPPLEPDAVGEIYVVGVDPDRQGTGLGRALDRRRVGVAARARHRRRDAVRRRGEHARGRPLSRAGLHRLAGRPELRPRARTPRSPAVMTASRYGATRDDVGKLLTEWGEPRYRADQVWDALYRQRRPLEEATALPRTLRDGIAHALPLGLSASVEQTSSDAMTSKWLWDCGDGAQVETVLMRYPTRATVCVSSQAGCAMACTFCATGQAGFERHLDAGEIVEQVLRAQHASPQRVSNVVYMGMGEPLANYDAVWASVERLHADVGISARHLTISTVGVVPGIRRLAEEGLPVTLAVSLHVPDDELRSRLVPLNRRYPIAEVLDAAAAFAAARGRRVTFEYACIAGVNDSPEQAMALGRRLASWPGAGGAHVNLIPLNPTGEFEGEAPPLPRLQGFAGRLRAAGIRATVRRNRGVEIDAACGQLRARRPIPPGAAEPTTMGA